MPAASDPTPAPRSARPSPPSDAAPAPLSTVLAAQRIDAATLDGVIERLAVGVLVLDPDGHVAYANAAARVLRATEAEPVRWAATRALLTGDRAREDDVELRGDDGACRWVAVEALRAGTPGAVVLTVCDVTARAEAARWRPVMESLVNL